MRTAKFFTKEDVEKIVFNNCNPLQLGRDGNWDASHLDFSNPTLSCGNEDSSIIVTGVRVDAPNINVTGSIIKTIVDGVYAFVI